MTRSCSVHQLLMIFTFTASNVYVMINVSVNYGIVKRPHFIPRFLPSRRINQRQSVMSYLTARVTNSVDQTNIGYYLRTLRKECVFFREQGDRLNK